jgi:hypothetical protein
MEIGIEKHFNFNTALNIIVELINFKIYVATLSASIFRTQ